MDSNVLDRKPYIATFVQVVAFVLLMTGLAIGVSSFVGELTEVPHLEQPQRLS